MKLAVIVALVLLSPAACQRPTIDFRRVGDARSYHVILTCVDDDGDPIPNARFFIDGTFDATQSDGIHEVTLTPSDEGAWICERLSGVGGKSEPLLLAGIASYTRRVMPPL